VNRQRDEAWRAARWAPFDLEQHTDLLIAILEEIQAAPQLSGKALTRILRRHTLPDGNVLSKGQLLSGYTQLCEQEGQAPDPELVRRLRVKPTRTISGVAPVTV
jgi:elongator complex protein 3